MELPLVCVSRAENGHIEAIRFDKIKRGDAFSVKGQVYVCGEDAHESGDASYEGWLLYDEDGNSWFPEDLDRREDLAL